LSGRHKRPIGNSTTNIVLTFVLIGLFLGGMLIVSTDRSLIFGPPVPLGTTELEVADVSQNVMTPPIHGQLLIRACEQITSDSDYDRYDCDLGLLDLEKERLVRLVRSEGEGEYSEIVWSPDGMQFSYHNSFSLFVGSSPTVIYCADGREQCNLDSYDAGSWSADARRYGAWTCRAPNLNPGNLFVVYDAVSWEPIRWVNESPMECRVEIPHCSLPSSCFPEEEAPREAESESRAMAPKEYESDRYQATIEDKGLRVIDTKTNTEKTYVIPGYRIMTIAWAPSS
jgi:hypothetical protein